MSESTNPLPPSSNRVTQVPEGFQAYCRDELIGTYSTEQRAWDEIQRLLARGPQQDSSPEQPQANQRPLTGDGPVAPPGGTV
ncbi:MAG: hypothetical protein JO015_11750 [Verrucomicrobia bacterium]|nr:hypothetical protein [Verrucomicrobiota bacterium]